jgi:hypothetical protein
MKELPRERVMVECLCAVACAKPAFTVWLPKPGAVASKLAA